MSAQVHNTVRIGELVVAVFDEASHYSADPREVSRLAMEALAHMLGTAHRIPVSARQTSPPEGFACSGS
jgi:hypothetical protein